ncbi:filamentous hemagglutinin N-terminal domain-containing protein [Roseomonas terrae]|uniref:Filamentous hemagglutinin N-terminal domain-containing protein n=2 Tax=Neoroseomonas terrae TaxID=424799 RepID=A0ABS5EQW1_9PROT|nr:filamentous hemagglutinin N-terminal domain-containing protein [Neoroseomonas terrae]
MMPRLHRFRSALLAGTALVLPVAAAAQAPNAAPVLDRVVAGSITVHQDAAQTTVQQAQQRGIVDWRSFNIGRDHTVRFQQPGASSITLNRVTTPDPSTIAGRISANGQVAIVNQSGVVFTQGAQVDAAGLIVSSANISNENFMAGRMVFDQPGRPDARIENAGTITIREAGLAALVAPQVANRGTIAARMGRVALAGAETHVIDLYGDGLLSIEVTGGVRQAPGNGGALVTNTGVIEAQGGTVLLTAAAADGIVQDLVRAGGTISADTDAATGRTGRIAINGTGGAVRIEGEVRATGTAAGTRGGQVEIVADRVLVDQGARVDASGRAGGGEVAIGTTVRGAANPRLARRAGIVQGATVRADATERGNGGTVIVNSQDYTGHAGSISARGGPQGGNGGFIEVSGQAGLLVLGTIDAGAPAGDPGTILIDPVNLTIVGEGDSIPGAGQAEMTGNILGEAAPPDEAYIWPSQFQTLDGDVLLQASNDITVNATITRGGNFPTSLTLDAGRDIIVNAPINGGGALALAAGRDITTNAAIQLAGDITIDAGRNLVIDGPLTALGTGAAVELFARAGTISFTTGQITGNGGTFAATAATGITSTTFVTGFGSISLTAQTGNVVLTAEAALNTGIEADGVSIVAGNAISLGGGDRSEGRVISTEGLVDLQAGAGGITQTASIRGGTLQVRSAGDAILDLTPTVPGRDVNRVDVLGASDVAGNFSFRASEIGDSAAPLIIDGVVRVGGRFSLESLVGVTQNESSAIITPDLTVTAFGDILLPGDNAITTISGMTTDFANLITIRNTTDLTIAGPVTLESPNLFTTIRIDVEGGNLTVAAPVTAISQEGIGLLTMTASGDLTVTAAGSVTAEGPLTSSITLLAAVDGGSSSEFLPGTLTLAGNVTAAGEVSLGAGTGGIVQTGGGITTGDLFVTSGGDALLSSPGNAVGALVSFFVDGTFVLDNGTNDLIVRSGPPSESNGTAGSIGLRTAGTVTLVDGALMEAIAEDGRISLRVGGLIAEADATIAANLIELAPFSPTPMRLPVAEAVPGQFSITPETFASFEFQSLRLGATTFDGVMTTTASELSLAATVFIPAAGPVVALAAVTVPGFLDLRSLGGIAQDAGAGIVAGTLTGASGGSTVLTDPDNVIATLGGFTAGGDFNLFSQGPLLTVPGGNLVTAGGALTIEVGGGSLLVNGTVQGGTTSLITDEALTVNGFSAIALNGALLLQAPVVTLNGLAQAAGDILVQAGTSASLTGIARTPGALSITSPTVTFGGLDATTADVRINLGSAGFASGALDAGGLLVQGGRGAALTGTIAGIAGRPAAAAGRRATAGGVLLPDPPPDMDSYTFNDCPIGASLCAAVPPPPEPPPPEPPPPVVPPDEGCVIDGIACAALPELALLNPFAVTAVLNPALILAAVDQLRPPTPELSLQPTRDPTEDSELAPPDIRGGDY